MEQHEKIFGKSKNAVIYKSLGFMAVVLILTLGMFLFNLKLEKDIRSVESQISDVNDSILDEKNDEDLQIYSLIKANKKSLDLLTKNSRISFYINKVKSIANRYGLEFGNFDLNSDNITVSLLSNSNEEALSFQKVKNFIKGYREADGAVFDLGFVNSLTGYETMRSNIKFKIK